MWEEKTEEDNNLKEKKRKSSIWLFKRIKVYDIFECENFTMNFFKNEQTIIKASIVIKTIKITIKV